MYDIYLKNRVKRNSAITINYDCTVVLKEKI